MGFMGVKKVVDVIEGRSVNPVVDTGAVYVDKSNISKPEAINVMY